MLNNYPNNLGTNSQKLAWKTSILELTPIFYVLYHFLYANVAKLKYSKALTSKI